MSQSITAIDLFCGAGGSSTGLVAAGVEVKTAINHWRRAIETHATNHPQTDHDCADVRLVKASYYPKADIFWASPECTNHSLAKGAKRKAINQMDLWGETNIDPAEERSRATMREVVDFAEYHRHAIVIVENVVDIRYWQHYESWIQDMSNLGYEHKALYLNAQFFNVPQSRDRIYVVFWRKGNKAPDLDFRPPALCEKHGKVEAVQAFKKPDFRWGRYGKNRQYVYVCPHCAATVQPFTVPAWTVIDWSIPSTKIGERDKPLKPKTINRIKAGLEKYAGTWMLVDTVNPGESGRVRSVDEPMGTQTSRQSYAMVSPFMLNYMNQETPPRSVDEPLHTIATQFGARLVTPPAFMLQYYSREAERGFPVSSIDEPIPTIPTHNRHGVVTMPFLAELWGTSETREADQPLSAVTGTQHHALVTPPFLAILKGTMTAISADDPLTTIVAAGSQHAVITPPFMTPVNHSDIRNDSVDDPLPTVMPHAVRGLVTPPLITSVNYFDDSSVPVDQPMHTLTTAAKSALLTPSITQETIDLMLPECGFRMLEPEELARGMSFAESYIILGNKRERVKQAGNAVCPNVAEWIARRCVESLS